MKVFSISAKLDGDEEEVSGLLVAEYDCTPSGYNDDQIFYYGLSEEDVKRLIETGESVQNEFIITGYDLHDETNEAVAEAVKYLLTKRYVHSEVTSGEFIHDEEIPYLIDGNIVDHMTVHLGVQRFLDWDESDVEFSCERTAAGWKIASSLCS